MPPGCTWGLGKAVESIKPRRRWGGGHAVCVLCRDGGGVRHKGGEKRGLRGEWGLSENLRQECVYLTRIHAPPAPTRFHDPRHISQDGGPDSGEVL